MADAASLIPLLESSSHLQLRIVLGTHISPALRAFGESHPDSASKVLILGRAWVALSLATLALYVPAIPIDPAVAQQVELALLKSQQARLEAEAFAHLRAEGQITGNATNPKILAAQERLVQIETELSQLGPLIVERETNVSLLNTMFKEIHHFLGEIVDPAKLQGLADSLAQTPDAQAFLREQSAQENIAGFLQRISQTYSLFADITQPLNLALSQLRSGLRFLARSTELRTALARGQSEADLVGTLASFPTAFAVQTLHVSELPVRLKSELPAVATSRLLLLEATSIGYDIAIGLCLDPGTVQSIGLIFDQLSHLWLMDREKEAQAEQEAQSLYRQRKVDEEILSDIELEEKEFKELFPQFGDIMDEDEANDVEPEAVAAASASKSKFILPDQASELHRLHGMSPCLLQPAHVWTEVCNIFFLFFLFQSLSFRPRLETPRNLPSLPSARTLSATFSPAIMMRSPTISTRPLRSRFSFSRTPLPASPQPRPPGTGRTTSTRTPTRTRCAKPCSSSAVSIAA